MNNDTCSLSFNGNDFTVFINFVKSMNSKDKSKYARLALLHVENNELVCRAVDDTSGYIEYHVELYTGDGNNIITEPFAISVNDLAALIKCADRDKFYIRKSFNQFEFNIIGDGWLPFKTSDFEADRFKLLGIEAEIGKINSSVLKNAISSVLGYTQEYTYARDKYIQFTPSQMVVTSRLSSVVTSGNFVEMTLHRDDAAMLRNLLKDDFDLTVSKITSAVEKLVFIGPKFKFAVVSSGIEQSNIKYVNDLNNYLRINCDELYKLAAFSEEYSASKRVIGFSIKDGKLQASIKNVLSAKHTSNIKSVAVGDVQDTTTDADVPAHSLMKALKLFQDKRSRDINIYIENKMLTNQNSIIIFDDSTQAIINIYNR